MGNTLETPMTRLVESMADQIISGLGGPTDLVLVGIRTRGDVLANRIEPLLRERGVTKLDRGTLDITLYRDDLSEIGPLPLVKPTVMDCDIGGRPLVIVDDVIFTGRSVRAALDALTDFGRPRVVRLAVLVDRGGRELPIHPDFVALRLPDLPPTQRVSVRLTETDNADQILVESR